MKRKINQVGNNTLTVSLPSKWTKKYNLNKGDELELIENGSELKINPGKQNLPKREITIKIDKAISSLIWRSLKSAYMNGYDKIIIEFVKEKTLYTSKDSFLKRNNNEVMTNELIHHIITSRLFGMIILEQSKNKFVITSIGSTDDIDIEPLLKKISLHVKSLAEKVNELLISRNTEQYDTVLSMENNINNLSDYAIRILNKKSRYETISYENYLIPSLLEKIGDHIFRIFELSIKYNIPFNVNTKKQFSKLIKAYDTFYQAYWFNKKEILQVYENIKYLHMEMEKNNLDRISFEIIQIIDCIQDIIEISLSSIYPNKLIEE